ncbi:hypothetical protein H310_04737 [Aphanomyces invadans]|uniref:Integrase catalytic domain-containing protein n=1 Tax=Aphanomyces invadans TaxID=157072 RepID=A0A024UFS6_9STRA|nr:hypothetical protein H310_04737 [Aphanomyces invadans]ETW04463.1 hypothetical protein H310_04737 [Aphanomyces invadans]|eukprot:XP_008867419.1 hypothetical protein H310_04737 [Aphanomyces invadans]
MGGCKYFVAYTEAHSNYTAVYPLKTKLADEVLASLQHFHAWLENQTGVYVTTFQLGQRH